VVATWNPGHPVAFEINFADTRIRPRDFRQGMTIDLIENNRRISFEPKTSSFLIEVEVKKFDFAIKFTDGKKPTMSQNGINFDYNGPMEITQNGTITLSFITEQPIRPWNRAKLQIPKIGNDEFFVDEQVRFRKKLEADGQNNIKIIDDENNYHIQLSNDSALPFDTIIRLKVNNDDEFFEEIIIKANESTSMSQLYSAEEFFQQFGLSPFWLNAENTPNRRVEPSTILSSECFITNENIELIPESVIPLGDEIKINFDLFVGSDVNRSEIVFIVSENERGFDEFDDTQEIKADRQLNSLLHISLNQNLPSGKHSLLVMRNETNIQDLEFDIGKNTWYIEQDKILPMTLSYGEITEPAIIKLRTNIPHEYITLSQGCEFVGKNEININSPLGGDVYMEFDSKITDEHLELNRKLLFDIMPPNATLHYRCNGEGDFSDYSEKITIYQQEPAKIECFKLEFNTCVSKKYEIKEVFIDDNEIQFSQELNKDEKNVILELNEPLEYDDNNKIMVKIVQTDDKEIVNQKITILRLEDDNPRVRLVESIMKLRDTHYEIARVSEEGNSEKWCLEYCGKTFELICKDEIVIIQLNDLVKLDRLMFDNQGRQNISWAITGVAKPADEFFSRESWPLECFSKFKKEVEDNMTKINQLIKKTRL